MLKFLKLAITQKSMLFFYFFFHHFYLEKFPKHYILMFFLEM